MPTQYLILHIVACETSVGEIVDLISGCRLADISGTVNTKYRDYAADDILDILWNKGFDVQRAKHLYDDGASMLCVQMAVPDSERERIEAWINENNGNSLSECIWGVSVGDSVDMPAPEETDSWNYEFQGIVIDFRASFAQVEDQDGDVFDILAERLNKADDYPTQLQKSFIAA